MTNVRIGGKVDMPKWFGDASYEYTALVSSVSHRLKFDSLAALNIAIEALLEELAI